MADPNTYRSRWDVCDDCECATLVERDDARGVPDTGEWEEFPRCMVCGGSLKFYNADEITVSNTYWRTGKRFGATAALREMAKNFRDIDMTTAADLCDEAADADAAVTA